MEIRRPHLESESLSAKEAKEWLMLQSAICQELSSRNVTSLSQIDPALVKSYQVHFVICEVEDHAPIPGLFSAE